MYFKAFNRRALPVERKNWYPDSVLQIKQIQISEIFQQVEKNLSISDILEPQCSFPGSLCSVFNIQVAKCLGFLSRSDFSFKHKYLARVFFALQFWDIFPIILVNKISTRKIWLARLVVVRINGGQSRQKRDKTLKLHSSQYQNKCGRFVESVWTTGVKGISVQQ